MSYPAMMVSQNDIICTVGGPIRVIAKPFHNKVQVLGYHWSQKSLLRSQEEDSLCTSTQSPTCLSP